LEQSEFAHCVRSEVCAFGASFQKGESMIALYIIAGIILLFLGIGFLRATVTIEYKDDMAIAVKVLFFNIKILPKKEKKPLDYSKYSAKKLRKLIKKQELKEKKKSFPGQRDAT
jgi:hypothetical protein